MKSTTAVEVSRFQCLSPNPQPVGIGKVSNQNLAPIPMDG